MPTRGIRVAACQSRSWPTSGACSDWRDLHSCYRLRFSRSRRRTHRSIAQGEIELYVASDVAGKMTVCLHALDGVNGRATYEVRSGESVRRPVVDGQRYQVHAHVEYPGGHVESEPIVFKGARGRAVLTLRPDAPRNLHP